MTAKYLVDTNLLVYAYDRSEPEKQAKAVEILDELVKNGTGILSPQVLSEFYTVVTRKLAAPLTPQEGYTSISNYIRSWNMVDLTSLVVLEAVRGVRDHRLSYWDSLIWATAKMNQIPTVLSEDFSSNSVIEGVRFTNPFKRK
ncbi:MAG: twitching motility protein PilT [Nitrospirae bacterium RBG_19FT_COMBO_55_12]|nr:MAG: twitching motility protein PilT [Nitrospirae bacterium RBG_19FT_COMBO_55_12]